MALSQKAIEEFKRIYEKETGIKLPDQEVFEVAHNVYNFVRVIVGCWEDDQVRQRKLKEYPKGFQLNGVGYTCAICGASTQENKNWYDKYGIKCTICQKAINRREIPPSLAKNKDSWYSQYDMKECFNLKVPTLRSWVKQGFLKARTVTYDGKQPYVQIFLIKDNKDILPPKKLVESRLVKETRDGKDWHHSEPWYKFVDPREHLKGYGIMNYLKVTSNGSGNG